MNKSSPCNHCGTFTEIREIAICEKCESVVDEAVRREARDAGYAEGVADVVAMLRANDLALSESGKAIGGERQQHRTHRAVLADILNDISRGFHIGAATKSGGR